MPAGRGSLGALSQATTCAQRGDLSVVTASNVGSGNTCHPAGWEGRMLALGTALPRSSTCSFDARGSAGEWGPGGK